MPEVKYTFRVMGEEETFTEKDILPHTGDPTLRAKQLLMLWNEKADERGEPERELVSVEVTNPLIHEHEWTVTVSGRVSGGRDYVRCINCEATGVRSQGSTTVYRDKAYGSPLYDHCLEPLKKLSKPRFK